MKAIDYLENGVTPILPDLPSYRDELDDRHAIFFRPDDPDSLAAALESAGARTADRAAVAELAERYSMAHRAERILALIGS